jgi:flagellar hook-basal body complex protein FliE
MNPLDALSALSSAGNFSMPGTTVNPVPSVDTGTIGEGMNFLHSASAPFTVTPVSVDPVSASSVLPTSSAPVTWGHMVQQMVMDVNAQQQGAAQKVNDVLRGGPTPIHEAMIASEQASLSFEFLSEMRNKVVDAYQQVMQMQV